MSLLLLFSGAGTPAAPSTTPAVAIITLTPSIAIGTRDRQTDAVVWHTAVAENSIGECPQRVTGRYIRVRWTAPASSDLKQIQGVELTARPEGKR